MIQSGLIQTDSRLNNITGVLWECPFFDQLDYTEENVDSSATWGTVTPGSGRYTTQKHTASTQYIPSSPVVLRLQQTCFTSTKPVSRHCKTLLLS